MNKFYLSIIGLLLIIFGGAVFVGKWYYKNTQEQLAQLNQDIATLKANQLILESTIETNNATIAKQQLDAEQFARANNQLRDRLTQAEQYTDELSAKLSNHNLTVLTLQRPGLIETRVNNATAKIFDDIEAITGATTSTDSE